MPLNAFLRTSRIQPVHAVSVKVNQLVKTFDGQRAVDVISFEARKGEVLGFLGPNGAGKTTTMKIVTGYLPQTAGKVEVCGFDITANPMEARARIGYLPEHNPCTAICTSANT